MKVIVSTAVSADGYLDDRSPDRLILSTPEDWAEVHRLRAACDAILVGAETIRRDNPSLLVGDEVLHRGTNRPGASVQPGQGNADRFVPALAGGQFLHPGEIRKRSSSPPAPIPGPLRQVATVIPAAEITAALIVTELEKRGLRSLLVEGGAATLRMFFAENLVDTFRLAVNPAVKVGDPRGTPFGDRFQLSANVAFDRIVGRNAGHDLCDQTRPDRRRPPLPANGDRRKPQMHPIDLFILCRCSDFND